MKGKIIKKCGNPDLGHALFEKGKREGKVNFFRYVFKVKIKLSTILGGFVF
jgi:hypothetical protein